MEVNEHDFFLEELLGLRRETWETIPTEMNEFLPNSGSWSFDSYNENNPPVGFVPNNSCFEGLSSSSSSLQNDNNFDQSFHHLFGDELSAMHITDSSSYNNHLVTTTHFLSHAEYPFPTAMENEEVIISVLGDDDLHNVETQGNGKKMEQILSHNNEEASAFNMGVCLEPKNRSKKVPGQPSKNLMAERRRRKRLNDRLSMLRSIVPKISKMDRTSILGDTIDYMKELLERIKSLQEKIEEGSKNPINLMNICKDLKPNEMMIRTSPKFDVARRDMDSLIEICCATKPGLLLSTINTLDSLGIEIQQCVISCFNDFAMHASCSEDLEHKTLVVSSEDIKQALFRNAGYGGRCL